MNILLGVSGGIAAYKACSLASYLRRDNDIKVVMTENAAKFVQPLTFATLSRHRVLMDTFEQEDGIVPHIYYTQDWADIIIIAPATADIIGKAAHGIADDILSSCLVATTKPIVFVPAMNRHMYENTFVQENMKKLKDAGMHFVEPDTGMLACGVEGIGKFPKMQKIVEAIDMISDRLHHSEPE